MNKVCKVKPTRCPICIAADKNYDMSYDCEKCKENNVVYELISVGHTDLDGDWAMVLKDGIIRRVELSRVWDVKEFFGHCTSGYLQPLHSDFRIPECVTTTASTQR